MTHVSHTVRSLRDDPISGETVGLVSTLAEDADPAAIRDDLAALNREVVRELDFGRFWRRPTTSDWAPSARSTA